MNLIKNIFTKKEAGIKSYQDFWTWFQTQEKEFLVVIKKRKNIEKNFFEKISPKLTELKEGYFFLVGMQDEGTVEFVLTADGDIAHIVFVEELIAAAPDIAGWKFTALKPALNLRDVNVEMAGFRFNNQKLSFYANELPAYPDEIDITIVYDDLTEANKTTATNGCYLFLDNYLGELAFITMIDNLTIIGKKDAKKELVPIDKLKEFLHWRQKEFIEKYEGARWDTENDHYSGIEAELENGHHLVATINTDLLNWDGKASHAWFLMIRVKYDGKDFNGMPSQPITELLYEMEDEIMEQLKDFEGYLNIGRQTGDNERQIYFACKDFRKPSKVLHQIQKHYTGRLDIQYDIYKDKYWQTVERFNIH